MDVVLIKTRARRTLRDLVLLSIGFHIRSALQWAIERTGETTTAPNLPHLNRPRRHT